VAAVANTAYILSSKGAAENLAARLPSLVWWKLSFMRSKIKPHWALESRVA